MTPTQPSQAVEAAVQMLDELCAIIGRYDLPNNPNHLVVKIEAVLPALRAELARPQEVAAVGDAPEGYIYDWVHSGALGKPEEHFTSFTRDKEYAYSNENPRAVYLAANLAPVRLDEIEQYRMQMAGISTASLGYWKEGDSIHPDYDTLALRDVAKLYAKYDALFKARMLATEQGDAKGPDSFHSDSGECGGVQTLGPRKSLNAKVADLLRPFLKEGQRVIWREAFRWHDDNGVLPNHYDGMELPRLSDDFGYGWDFDFDFHHAAIVTMYASKGEQP